MHNEQMALKNFRFSLFSSVLEKTRVDPKNVVFGMGWTWVAGLRMISLQLNLKSWKFDATFFIRYLKSIISNFSVKLIHKARPRVPYSG